jgi:hypothetical protein
VRTAWPRQVGSALLSAAHSGGVGNIDSGELEPTPGTPMTAGGCGTYCPCRLRFGDVKWRSGDGYLIHRPGKRYEGPSCPKHTLWSV